MGACETGNCLDCKTDDDQRTCDWAFHANDKTASYICKLDDTSDEDRYRDNTNKHNFTVSSSNCGEGNGGCDWIRQSWNKQNIDEGFTGHAVITESDIGKHHVCIYAFDKSGNMNKDCTWEDGFKPVTNTCCRTIDVVDTQEPVITLHTRNDDLLQVGDAYNTENAAGHPSSNPNINPTFHDQRGDGFTTGRLVDGSTITKHNPQTNPPQSFLESDFTGSTLMTEQSTNFNGWLLFAAAALSGIAMTSILDKSQNIITVPV